MSITTLEGEQAHVFKCDLCGRTECIPIYANSKIGWMKHVKVVPCFKEGQAPTREFHICIPCSQTLDSIDKRSIYDYESPANYLRLRLNRVNTVLNNHYRSCPFLEAMDLANMCNFPEGIKRAGLVLYRRYLEERLSEHGFEVREDRSLVRKLELED